MELSGKLGGMELELHAVGHSAEAIKLGHLLEGSAVSIWPPRRARRGSRLRAISPRGSKASSRWDRLWLYVLSDENEKLDALPKPDLGVYGEALLDMVSRALDDVRGMPLLGMERALSNKYADPRSREATDQWESGEIPLVKGAHRHA